MLLVKGEGTCRGNTKVNRNITYDILRVLACMMIVAMHSPLPCEHANGALVSALSYLTAPGIGLFFMISGALLLPVKQGTSFFLKKRFTKMLYPTLFWSLFYLCMNVWLRGEEVSWGRSLLSLPFSTQGNPVLWFMYTLLGLYLLAPILSRWLQAASQRELTFYMALWAITLCYPLLRYIVDVNTSNTGVLYYFTGYVGYFVLGYYLKHNPRIFSMKWSFFAFGVALGVPIACKLLGYQVDFYDLFWYLSIFVVIQCVFWWKIIGRIQDVGRFTNFLTLLSNLSFGIYLVHIFVMRYMLWHWSVILNIGNHALQTFTIASLTFIISALVSYIISFVPGSQYLIGYKRATIGQ